MLLSSLIFVNISISLLAAAAAIDPDVRQNYYLEDKSRSNDDDRFCTPQGHPYRNYLVICEQDQSVLSDVDWVSLIYDTPFGDDIADILELSYAREKDISSESLRELRSRCLNLEPILDEIKELICPNIAWHLEDLSNVNDGRQNSFHTPLVRIYALFFVSLLCAYLFLGSLAATEKDAIAQSQKERILESQAKVERVIFACEPDIDIGSDFDDSDYPMG